MPRSSHGAQQAAAKARERLRPLATLREEAQVGQPISAAELQNAIAQAASPGQDAATRSQALNLALQATRQTPELAGPHELARLVTLKQNATATALARQAGNILGLLLAHTLSGGHQPAIILRSNRSLPPHKVPAVLDMGGHVLMSLGLPTTEAVNKMMGVPHMRPVDGQVQFFTSPLQLTRTLLNGKAGDMRTVLPAMLLSLQEASAINKTEPPRFRGAGTALRAVVKELTAPPHLTATTSLLPRWPKAVQKLFPAPKR